MSRPAHRFGVVFGLTVTAILGAGAQQDRPVSQAETDAAKGALGRAQSLRDERRWDEAIAASDEALQHDPRSAQAYSGRGIAWVAKRQYAKAIEDFGAALRLDSKLARAWAGRAEAHRLLEHLKEAIADSTTAIELDPMLARAFRTRGESYLAGGQTEGALSDVNKAIALDPKYAAAYFARGNIHRKLGNADQAIADYSKGIEFDSSSPRPLYIRADLYRKVGKPELAIADYSRVIGIDAKKPAAYRGRGEAYFRIEKYQLAIADFSQALSMDDKLAEVYAARGEAYRRTGLIEKAIADFEQGLKLEPSLTGVDTLLVAARTSRFVQNADQAVSSEEDRKNSEQAARGIEDRLRGHPQDENAEMWVGLGTMRGLLGDQDKALAAFDRALELTPESIDAHFGRGVTLHRLKHFEDSAAEYEFVVRAQPDNPAAWMHLGIACGELGRGPDERRHYERALKLDPENVTILFNLGIACYEDQDLDQARRHFEAYLRQRPNDADGHANLAAVLIDLDHADRRLVADGLAAAQRALKLEPDQDVAMFNAGLAHLLLGDGVECDRLLPRLRSLAPERATKLEGLRVVLTPSKGSSPQQKLDDLSKQLPALREAENHAQAILVAEKAYLIAEQTLGRTHPSALRALHDLAAVEIGLGRLQDAYEHLKQVRAQGDSESATRDPLESASVLHDLAKVELYLGQLDDCEKNCRESLELRQKLTPDSSQARIEGLALLAEILIAQGRETEAERFLEQWTESVQQSSKSPTENTAGDLRALGVAMLRMGNVTEGRANLQHALEVGRSLHRDAEAGRAEAMLAALDLREGKPQEALSKLDHATEILDRILGDFHPEAGVGHALLGHASRSVGRYDEAERELRKALGVYQANRSQPRGELQRAVFGERLGVAYATSELTATLIRLGRHVEAMQAVEEVRAGALLQRMRSAGKYVSPFAWKTLRSSLSKDDVFLSIQWSAGVISAIVISPTPGEPEARGWILADDPRHIEELARRASELTKWLGKPPGSKSRPDVSALATELGRALFLPKAEDASGDDLAELRQRLGRAERVIVVPDTLLTQIPFDLLMQGVLDGLKKSPEKSLRGAANSSQINVVYEPSANVFSHLRDLSRKKQRKAPSKPNLLLVGPPSAWPSSALAGVSIPSGTDHGFADMHLVDTPTLGSSLAIQKGVDNQEIRARAESRGHHVSLLEVDKATREEVERNAAGKQIIHFLAHGFPGSKTNPYDARVMMTPADLPPDLDRDTLTLDRVLKEWTDRLDDCRLISFAACKTQLAVPIGTNSITLPWGCFYAGCPTVIATLWDVKQDAAYQLMNRFYENLLGAHDDSREIGIAKFDQGELMNASQALAEARRFLAGMRPRPDFAREGEPGDYSDPYYWAGFVLTGEPD